MKIKRLFFLFVVASLLCGSCASKPEAASEPPMGLEVPLKDMNTGICLQNDPGLENTYKNRRLLTFWVDNCSEKVIVFPGDFGIKIYYLEDDQWKQAKNGLANPTNEIYIKPCKEQWPRQVAASIPYIPDLKEPTKIRVVVIGHVKDRPEEKIGAYVDIELLP